MNMNLCWRLTRSFSQPARLRRQSLDIFSCRFPFTSKTSHIYHPEADVEYLEEYVPGGYHPTLIGDTFCSGRYAIVHKLGFGGYSTIWLARDQQRGRYVSLKILTARASPDSREGKILDYLMKSDIDHPGKRFIPPLLDQFSFHGPNGHHRCLVGEPAGSSISKSKEDSTDLMFPVDAARSTAAQLLLGLSYLHANGVCHGDFDRLSTAEIYQRFGEPIDVPVQRLDGKPSEPHAPPHAIYPMAMNMPANEQNDPEIIISDYGTSFLVSQTPSPTLHTPVLYSPPEDLFNEPIIQPTAADIWTLGVTLYEMINTLGQPPSRWWSSWANRSEFFEEDGSWVADFRRISTPVFRRLPQRLCDMGRGETEQTCEWDVAGGELRALEDLLRSMMAFEPAERPTADQLLRSEYMVKWALPAWERQKSRSLK
ncbi:hypothetical protein ASPZODRAFT_157692 [Penicilliopsis zonata CBS 506.65]|uniref:non-specific serine/threonine protein kinase n=1 Tax=Penicilliopsis zonata CBS 506.65 TaxID=1073090 RepID=A0A1L9SQ16_9EURO|nr:hypothetical protein ASPZODRAFT_157692 [Penicilliopsis zonata CBS 506.65]OJJ49268.1 hypothetical protein ASPZODRAFT_157692 [Penicilliopsis zonata CBS 506.65]